MKTHYKKIATLAPTILLTAALASCGGGGGGGGGSGLTYQSAVTTDPSLSPPGTYSADDIAILTQLSAIRPVAGYITPDADLDTAANAHVDYLFNNGLLNATLFPGYLTSLNPPPSGTILGGHYESTILPDLSSSTSTGFYETTPQSRATKAGYTGTVTELMTFGATSGANCVDLLGDSVYHLVDLVSPFVDLGIAYNAGGGNDSSACAIEVGVKNNTLGQLPATGPVFYPYDTQTGVLPTFYNHAENPVPQPDLSTAGHPVIVSLYTLAFPTLTGSNIVINTFSITRDGDLNPLAGVRVLTKSGVTSTPITGPTLTVDNVIPSAGFIVLLPEAPLDPNQQYDVSFSAMVKGNLVSKDWIFTTGAAN